MRKPSNHSPGSGSRRGDGSQIAAALKSRWIFSCSSSESFHRG